MRCKSHHALLWGTGYLFYFLLSGQRMKLFFDEGSGEGVSILKRTFPDPLLELLWHDCLTKPRQKVQNCAAIIQADRPPGRRGPKECIARRE